MWRETLCKLGGQESERFGSWPLVGGVPVDWMKHLNLFKTIVTVHFDTSDRFLRMREYPTKSLFAIRPIVTHLNVAAAALESLEVENVRHPQMVVLCKNLFFHTHRGFYVRSEV